MNRRSVVFVIICCLPLISLSGLASTSEDERVMFKVPHAFTVGDNLMPAGRYSISTEAGDTAILHLHNLAGEVCARLPVITRLARHAHNDAKARIVFDRVGGQNLLSEVWFTGEDGFLVRGTPKDHSHEIVYFGS